MDTEVKKPFYKAWWFWVIVGIVVLGIIVRAPEKTRSVTPSETASPTPTIEITPTIEVTPTPEPTSAPVDASSSESTISVDVALSMMQSAFADTATVEYDEELTVFIITPTEDGFVNDLLLVINGDESAKASWDNLVESFRATSENIPGYMISLANPTNTENTLLIVMDGIVAYDFMQE